MIGECNRLSSKLLSIQLAWHPSPSIFPPQLCPFPTHHWRSTAKRGRCRVRKRRASRQRKFIAAMIFWKMIPQMRRKLGPYKKSHALIFVERQLHVCSIHTHNLSLCLSLSLYFSFSFFLSFFLSLSLVPLVPSTSQSHSISLNLFFCFFF